MKNKSMTFVGIISSVCLTVMSLGVANAQTAVLVLNPSFEDPAQGSGGYTIGSIPGWGASNNGAYGVQYFQSGQFPAAGSNGPLPAPADGNQALFINQQASVYQDVGTLLADTTYTLTLAIGNRLDQQGGGIFALLNGTDYTGTVLVSSPQLEAPAGTFELESISFTTGDTVSGDLTIDFQVNEGDQLIVDNVKLTAESAAVPEPSSLALLFLGLGVVMVRAYRMNQNS